MPRPGDAARVGRVAGWHGSRVAKNVTAKVAGQKWPATAKVAGSHISWLGVVHRRKQESNPELREVQDKDVTAKNKSLVPQKLSKVYWI